MRPFWKDLLWGILIGFVLPGVVVNYTTSVADLMSRDQTSLQQPKNIAVMESTQPASVTTVPTEPYAPLTMKIRNSEGQAEQWDMDTYLVGVVLAEMPAYFEMDALKAQAVVARTYALKAGQTGGKHGDGSVCTSSMCCQAYISPEEYVSQGGTSKSVEKVKQAVFQTSGQVLCYEGELIEATYFSCSGGRTEDALAVWGTDYPYLRSVESPGEEAAAHYQDSVSFSVEAFAASLGISQDQALSIGPATYTSGGGIAEISIGGKKFTGTQLRQMLGLRSTDIALEVKDGAVWITTMGFGHRVGMSQYGADAMAAAGSDYRQILAYYYQGTQLLQWKS